MSRSLDVRSNFRQKLDPYQDSPDRIKAIGSTVKSLVIMSIFVSLFLIFREGTDDMELDKYKPLFMSIYLISIISVSIGSRLNSLKLEDNNFDVYKDEVSH